MAVDIQIEGVSYLSGTSYNVPLDTISVDQDIAIQQTSARFDVHIQGSYSGGVISWPIGRPRAGQEVVFYNASGGREFGGILLQVEEDEIAPLRMVYHCTCGDYTKWFDRHLVNDTYASNITVQSLISDIVTKYVNTVGNTRTFTMNNVQQFPSIPLPIQQFIYVPPSQVMGQLVQALGWGFFIDFDRDVNFFSKENFISPLPNNTLDADDLFNGGTSGVGNWVDLKLTEDASQIKNRVFITGIYVAQDALYTEQFTGDGQTLMFTMGYQPPNDVTRITVSVGGTQYQIAQDLIDGTPGGPSEPDTVYVNFSNQTLRFGTAPVNGTTIVVDYYPMGPTVVAQDNAQSQTYMHNIDGTDGIYEFNRMDPSLSAETPDLANQRASMTLTKYAWPYLSGSFRSFLSGWRVGQYFNFTSQRRFQGGFASYSYGSQFFVIRVQKSIVQIDEGGDWLWQYTVQFANVPFSL